MAVDVIACIILLASAVISILRGFIREVLTILGIVGGSIAAYIGGPLLLPMMNGWLGVVEGEEDPEKLFDIIPYPMLAGGLSYALIFVTFVIILSVISYFLAESAKNIGLGAVDRTLGMVFGLVRGVLFLGLLYLPVYYLVDEEQMEEWNWLNSSKSRVYIETTSAWIAGFVPKESVESIAQATEQMGEQVGEANELRKKLQEMDVLKTEGEAGNAEGDSSEEGAEGDKSAEGAGAEGYSDEFRSKMDELIERTTEE